MKKNYSKSVVLSIMLSSVAHFPTFAKSGDMEISAQTFPVEQYRNHIGDIDVQETRIDERNFNIQFTSFDGQVVKGQIRYPEAKQEKYPMLIAMHAMGRSYPRWFSSEINGRATITQVDKLAKTANHKGYAVIALDARHHGTRKQQDITLTDIMTDLHSGNKTAYQNMIQKSVMDYKLLLDWLSKQQQFSGESMSVAGYSMGGQMAILLAATDPRVTNVLSIVPPHVESDLTAISPLLAAPLLRDKRVLFVSANQDEYASETDNSLLFQAIESSDKLRLVFNAGHILPENYTSALEFWF